MNNSYNIAKWLGTSLIIAATICRAANIHFADVLLSLLGGLVWAGVAYKTRDMALFTVNAFITAILTIGIFADVF